MDDAHSRYLEAQVLTATPQKLRLMAIEAALGAARQALACWEQNDNQQALEALTRCRQLVSELLSAVKPDQTELTRRVAAVYLFLYRCLTEAQLRRDRGRVEEVIGVLQVERETWRQVCQQMPDAPRPAEAGADGSEITDRDAAGVLPPRPDHDQTGGSLLLDA